MTWPYLVTYISYPYQHSTKRLLSMLNQTRTWITTTSSSHSMLQYYKLNTHLHDNLITTVPSIKALKLMVTGDRALCLCCSARRRVRYEDDDEEEEEYGHNEEIALLEFYSQSAREEALLVLAIVDEQQVEVLIFKGFSSCLSYKTSPDPSKSVLPARAIIKSIDRIKGPFDPSNIEYLEKGLTLQAIKARIAPP